MAGVSGADLARQLHSATQKAAELRNAAAEKVQQTYAAQQSQQTGQAAQQQAAAQTQGGAKK